MNTKKVFKRITAVAAGATMLGATMMGALAADLSDYPDAMVSDGVFDGFFVVGENAMNIDSAAALEMIGNMWYMSAGETATVTVEGDSWKIGTSTNILTLNEDPYDIKSFVGDSELAALADGEITNEKGTAAYEQKIKLQDNAMNVTFAENDDDVLDLFLLIPNTKMFAEYELSFTSYLESDEVSDTLDDLDDEQITMLGKTFDIVAAVNTSNGAKLTLMAGSVTDTLSEGETATYEIGDASYEVEVLFIDSDEAKLSVNGESSDKMNEGGTDKMNDGTVIGVKEINYQDYAGGIHQVEFYVGADKMILEDNQNVEYNDETIDDATVGWTTTESNDVWSFQKLIVNMTADDDFYVGAGEKLSENAELDEPEVLFTQNWDLEYLGLTDETTQEYELYGSGDDKYKLTFTDVDGNDVSTPISYCTGDTLRPGDKNNRLVIADDQIVKDEYFILNTDSDDDSISFVLQYNGADKYSDTSPKGKFDILNTGESLELSIDTSTNDSSLYLSGTEWTVNYDDFATDDSNITVDAVTTGATTPNNELWTENGVMFELWGENGTGTVVTSRDTMSTSGHLSFNMSEMNADLYDDTSADGEFLEYNITCSGGDTDLTEVSNTGLLSGDMQSDANVDYHTFGYTEFGTYIDYYTPSTASTPDTLTVTVPSTQYEALVYITSGATTSTSAAEGTLAQVQVVDASKLDSEIADVSAQNLIVIGGPCVNTVAAELLGNPANCADGFTPGVARVKWFDNNGAYAMLVAGYSGEDTRLAGRVISHRWDELTGDEVEIEGTTYSDATIAAPSAAPVVVEEPAADDTTDADADADVDADADADATE